MINMRAPLAYVTGSLLLALTATGGNAGPIEGSGFSYGNWSGWAYTFDGIEAFSHCGVAASYVSGDNLAFSINRDASISIALSNANWNLRVGQTFDVEVKIDRRAPFYGTAEAISKTAARLVIRDFERALRAIQKGYTMTIIANGRQGVYDLTGTFGALERAKRCAQMYYDYPRIAAPQPSLDRPHAYGSAAQPGAKRQVDPAIAGESVDIAYLYQLATVMITEAKIDDFQYLTEQEMASLGLSNAVVWRSESRGMIGGVSAFYTNRNINLGALGANILGANAQTCSGDIVTGSRAIEHATFPGRESRAVCSAGDDSYELFLTHTLVEDILVTLLLIFSGNKAIQTPESRQMSEDIRVRTASFVAEKFDQ